MGTLERVDVLIVGGGPAGSTCARELVKAGLDVLLVERAQFPRDKVCAGWITPAVVRALDLDLGDYAQARTLQPFTGFRTGPIDGPTRLTDFEGTISYGIRRCEFDDYLVRRSGVRRLEGETVQRLQRDRDGWIVGDRLHARVVVGAGGHFCPVARQINQDRPDAPAVAAQEIEFALDPAYGDSCPVDGASPELYFWPDFGGYAWCIRKGGFLNVGAGRLSPLPLPPAVREFAGALAGRGVLPSSPPRWKGHAYLLNTISRRRLHAGGVLLVGDAAGLALAPSGEGILAAVESGLLAAETLVSARGDYGANRLAGYAQQIAHRFGERTGGSPRFLPGWMATPAFKALLGLPWLTRRLLLENAFLHLRREDIRIAS